MPSPRLALFTLEALPSAGAVRRFVEEHADQIAFVGLSNAERPDAGGLFGQIWRHLRRSGPLILPYLAINFGIPDVVRALYPLTSRLRRKPSPAAATPLKALCRRHSIPTLRVDDVNGPEVAALLAAHTPDLIVSFHFDQIFLVDTLVLARLGGLNVHPSLLPLHRGPAPTIYALAEDRSTFGVTVHRLVAQIDAGGILAQSRVAVPAACSASSAAVLLHERGRLLLQDVLATLGKSGLPDGVVVEPLAYCPFPSAAFLWKMHRQGRRLTNWLDVQLALGLRHTVSTERSPDELILPASHPTRTDG